MGSEHPLKSFDCVQSMRRIRDRISEQIAEMDYEELVAWLRSQRFSDPLLEELASAARAADAKGTDRAGRE